MGGSPACRGGRALILVPAPVRVIQPDGRHAGDVGLSREIVSMGMGGHLRLGQVEELRGTKAAREAQADAIGAFMFEVQELDTLSEFDEKLWLTVIDTVTVHADGRMTFKFQGGTEIDV